MGLDLGPIFDQAQQDLLGGRMAAARAAAGILEAALEELVAPPWDPRRGRLLLHRVRVADADEGPQAAAGLAQELMEQAERHGWVNQLPEAVRLLGLCAASEGERPRALTLLKRSRALAVAAGDAIQEGRAIWAHARVVLIGGDVDLALELVDLASDRLAAGGGDPLYEAYVHNLLGTIQKRRGDRVGGRAHFEQAMAGFDALGHAQGSAENRQALFVMSQQDGEPQRAAVLIQEALAIQEACGNLGGLSRCLNLVGELHREAGELDAAERAYRRALDVAVQAGLSREALFPRINLAQVLQSKQQHEEAAGLFEDVLHNGGLGAALEGCLHGVSLETFQALGRVDDWEAHLAQAERLLNETRTSDPDVARAASRSAVGSERRWREGADPVARSRAARAQALAWRTWSGLSRPEQTARAAEDLRRLADGEGPIPLDDFDLVTVAGQGAMGTVWQARHRPTGEAVAVKVLRGARAQDPKVQAAFRSEVRALAGLDHPNIAWILGQGVVGEPAAWVSGARLVAGSPYLALEYAGGGSLVGAAGSLVWSELSSLLLSLLAGLAHAHGRGVLHRDLKPANVLLGDGDTLGDSVRLVDFGLAAAAGAGEGLGRTASGTPGYMAPEQFQAQWRDQGPWTDLYALGCLATELVQGTPPFVAGTRSELQALHRFADVPPLKPLVPIPEGLEVWLKRLLSKSAADRFSSAAAAAESLRDLDGDLVASVPAPPVPTHATAASTWYAVSEPAPAPAAGAPSPMAPLASASLPDAPPADPPPRALLASPGASLFGLRTPRLVGREPEVQVLWDALRAVARTGQARTVLVSGSAGVGRTRLGSWFATKVRASGAAIVGESRHLPGGAAGSVYRQLAGSWLGIDGLDASGARARLSSLLIGGQPLGLPLVEDLVRRSQLDAEPGSPGDAREQGALGLRLISLATAGGPVVLWLDDLQWNEATLGWVAQLLRVSRATPLPVLVVASTQDEALAEAPAAQARRDSLLAMAEVSELALSPLSDRDMHVLLRAVVGLAPQPTRALMRRSGGIPQLAVHVVADLVDRGLLVHGPDGVVLRAGRKLEVPPDLLATWQARIDRVSATIGGQALEALELAALIGGDVPTVLWEAACAAAGVALPEGLADRLLDLHLARAEPSGWRFTNALLRHCLARSAEQHGRLAPWHSAAADALSATGGGVLEQGFHRHRAGEFAVAVPLLFEVLSQLRASGERGKAKLAIVMARESLDALGVPHSDARWLEWRLQDLLVRRDEVGFGLGQGAAAEVAEEAAALGHARLAARAWVIAGNAARHSGRLEAAVTYMERGRLGYEALGDVDGLVRAHRALSGVARVRGDLDDAWDHLQRCLSLEPLLVDGDGRLGLWHSMALVAFARGDRTTAESLVRKTRELAKTLCAKGVEASTLNGIAECARRRGDHANAVLGFREAMELNRGLGTLGYTLASLNLAQALLEMGQTDQAHRGFQDVLRGLTRQGRHHLTVLPEVGLLASVSGPIPDPEWAAAWERIEALLEATPLREDDLASLGEQAGWRAHSHGAPHQARRAWTFAQEHWRLLGRTERADTVGGWLADLDG